MNEYSVDGWGHAPLVALKYLETPHTREGAKGARSQGNDETGEVALDIRRTFKL